MEIKCHIKDPEFGMRLERLLDSLSLVYNLDALKFLEVWNKIPEPVFKELYRVENVNFADTPQEDLVEYVNELKECYKQGSLKRNLKMRLPIKKKNHTFTLRNPDDLKQFEEFLDRMLALLNLSKEHFLMMLPRCPIAYWDKIDDLRETSFKVNGDSPEFLRCLTKCKTISFAYSTATVVRNEEDDFNDDDDDDY